MKRHEQFSIGIDEDILFNIVSQRLFDQISLECWSFTVERVQVPLIEILCNQLSEKVQYCLEQV